jgi:hypothetical protein
MRIGLRAALVAVVACMAGCYDFGMLGAAPPADMTAAAVVMDLSPPIPPTPDAGCTTLDDCAEGQNCVGSACEPALADCAALKQAVPGASDGVYWIAPGGKRQRAYCDMQIGMALCTDEVAAHGGKARDGSGLALAFTSVLSRDAASCDLWALRASDGYPMIELFHNGMTTMNTCQALGFLDDVQLGQCAYGTGFNSTCGFTVSSTLGYGNHCSGCMMNDHDYPHWVLQGPMITSNVLTDASGTTRTRCRTR